MTLVSSLNIAQQALSVNQSAITVVSNNIANVDNQNYSKLSPILADVVNPINIPGAVAQANSLSGVQLSKIQRYTDSFLQNYYWNQNSTSSYYTKYSSSASDVENIMNTMQNSGLSNAISSFYKAVGNLNNNPTDASARANFVSTAENLCSVLNQSYSNLADIRKSLVGDVNVLGSIDSSEISSETTSVNSILDQLASVNDSLTKTTASGIASSSLLDERDSLLTQLSSYLNVTIETNDNGTANVSLGKYDLVSGSAVSGYLDAVAGTTSNPAQINIVDSNNNILYSNINSTITDGSMAAILDIGGSNASKFTINGVESDLDTLASSFANIMNDIQRGDPNSDGSVALCINSATKQLIQATNPLFVNSSTGTATGVSASNISFNSTVANDPNLIATARVSAAVFAAGTYVSDTGNNANSTMLLQSRSNTYNNPVKGENLNGQTIEGYLATTVSSIGYSVSNISNSETTQSSVLSQIKSQLSSEKGVNLDEELANLVKYQQAYQAAAKVFSTCNSLMETLMNLGS